MKKQYIFLIMIVIILYISYLIIVFTYEDYKTNSNIDYITTLNNEIKEKNKLALDIIKYKKSKAYRNKILKEQQSFKNKWEKVIYLTTEKKYNKFTKEVLPKEELTSASTIKKETFIDSMTVYEKWMYFLFKKDIR